MKKFWQIILGIGSLLAMILGVIAMLPQGETVASAQAKQKKIQEEAAKKKEDLRLAALKEKKRLAGRTPEEIRREYYDSHPKIDREASVDKHVSKAMKQAAKFLKKESS